MRVQIIHYQNNLFSIGIHDIRQILYFLCPVFCCAVFPYTYMVHSSKWFDKGKDASYSVTAIFRIHLFVVPWTHSPRISHLAQQLVRLFIHTDYWNCRIIRHFINVKDVFHTRYKFCVCFVWEAPVLAAVRSKPVFFKVLRIASRLIGSSNSIFA